MRGATEASGRAMEIHANLKCLGTRLPPQVGDSRGLPNEVMGAKTGQCTNV
jgi:hypothetical protein